MSIGLDHEVRSRADNIADAYEELQEDGDGIGLARRFDEPDEFPGQAVVRLLAKRGRPRWSLARRPATARLHGVLTWAAVRLRQPLDPGTCATSKVDEPFSSATTREPITDVTLGR